MIIHEMKLHESNLLRDLLPLLRDRIFHVTSHRAFRKIIKCGEIRSNNYGEFPFTFPQSENNYGRKRGYVCLFDLCGKSDNELQNALDCFFFLGPRQLGNKPVFLIIDDICHNIIVGNTTAVRERTYREMFIPKAECWYPGNVPISNVRDAIIVNIRRRKASGMTKILQHIDKEETLGTKTRRLTTG